MSLRDLLGAASKQRLEKLAERVDGLDEELDQLFDFAQENREDLQEVEETTKRLDDVVEDLREEVLEDEQIELEPMEQEIFKVLMKAEEPLTNSEVGERMEEERSGDQVRPKMNSLKEKLTVLEDKKGRAKAYSIPTKVKKDYIEKGEIAEVSQELK